MIKVTGNYKGKPITVFWNEGILIAPDDYAAEAESLFTQPQLDLGPLTLLENPSVSREDDAVFVIEHLFDSITSTNTGLGPWQSEHDVSIDDIVKHYGPGPHPGTGSEQTAHGGGSQPQLDDDLFGPAPPTPKTTLRFTVDERKSRLDLATDRNLDEVWNDLFGRDHPASKLEPLNYEEQLAVRHAVEAWEELYGADTLPDEIEFRVSTTNDPAVAWVNPNDPDHANVIFVNDRVWNDEFQSDEMLAIIMQDPSVFSVGDYVKAISESPDAEYLANDYSLRIGMLFHEVAHISALHQGWESGTWPEELPFYSQDFYPTQVPYNSPLLPSSYAAENKFEFFAEAMTDVWINGDEAAPMSLRTAEIFEEIRKK